MLTAVTHYKLLVVAIEKKSQCRPLDSSANTHYTSRELECHDITQEYSQLYEVKSLQRNTRIIVIKFCMDRILRNHSRCVQSKPSTLRNDYFYFSTEVFRRFVKLHVQQQQASQLLHSTLNAVLRVSTNVSPQ